MTYFNKGNVVGITDGCTRVVMTGVSSKDRGLLRILRHMKKGRDGSSHKDFYLRTIYTQEKFIYCGFCFYR